MKRYTLIFALIATAAIAGSIGTGGQFTTKAIAWLLKNGTNTITESENGLGWADGLMTLQTPHGALQFDEVGTPAEDVIYWPGTIDAAKIDAAEIVGNITGAQITSGTIPGAVVRQSMTTPMLTWQDSSTYAGANGLTYTNTGPLSASEPSTPGNYFAAITVDDGGTEAVNTLRGTIKDHTQMAVPRIVSVPATATSTGTTGDVAYDTSYTYRCVATNTWRRVAHSSW